jgi:hypothetical protein
METKTTSIHTQSWAYLGKVNRTQKQTKQVFFFLHHNPFNYLLPNNIFAPLYKQLLINHMVISLQKVEIPCAHICN